MITIKPANPAVNVRKQDGPFLAEDGEPVTRTAYWVRRLNDGDVVEVKDQAEADAAVESTPKKDK